MVSLARDGFAYFIYSDRWYTGLKSLPHVVIYYINFTIRGLPIIKQSNSRKKISIFIYYYFMTVDFFTHLFNTIKTVTNKITDCKTNILLHLSNLIYPLIAIFNLIRPTKSIYSSMIKTRQVKRTKWSDFTEFHNVPTAALSC